MRQHLKYFSNIFCISVFTASIILSVISMSGCSYFKKSEPENNQSQKIEKQKTEINETGQKLSTEPKVPALSEEKDKEVEDNYSTAAYYYYMKSERHKQNGEIQLAIDTLEQAIAIDPDSLYLKKNLILLHMLNKDNQSAMKIATEMDRQHPYNEDILVVLAKLKLQSNQIKEAQTLYQQIIKINPKNHDVYILLGNIYINNGQNEEAFKLFSEMVKGFPDSYGAHFFMGKLEANKKNFVRAEKELLKSIELRGELVEPRFELIKIYKSKLTAKGSKVSQNSQTQKVLNLYEEILKIEKNNIKAAIELPLYLYKNGERTKASAMLIDFGKRYQHDDAMMVGMVKELINNENKDDAVIVFTELLKQDYNISGDSAANLDKSAIHYLAGLTFDSLKESKRAIDHFLQVSPDSAQYKKSIFHIAYIYSQLGQNNKSIKFLESKSGEFPGDTELIAYLSAFYEEDNQLEKAIDMLQQGIKSAPDDTELIFRYGILLDKLGDKNASIAAMKRVIALDSDHASALNYLGYTYAELGNNLDEAEELIKRSLALKPDDGYITDSLGWVYYKKGEYDKAIEFLERAVSLSSGDPVISEHLGDVYKEKKLYSKAIDAYRKALAKNNNPENKPVIEKKIYEIETMIKKN